MSDSETLKQGPEVAVGTPLVGHTPWNVMAEQEDGDKKYWTQVIPSEFGDLYLALEQYSDGKERWVTNHGEVQVVTSLGLDEPAIVHEIQTQPLHKWDDIEIYETGIREYREAHSEN
jgi:hypothetical protein